MMLRCTCCCADAQGAPKRSPHRAAGWHRGCAAACAAPSGGGASCCGPRYQSREARARVVQPRRVYSEATALIESGTAL